MATLKPPDDHPDFVRFGFAAAMIAGCILYLRMKGVIL